MITILVTNRKGGVGKTTTCINLGAWLGKRGKKTLLVDLDTQSHLQYGLGIQKPFNNGIHDILLRKDRSISEIIHITDFENLDLVPASINFDISAIGNNTDLLYEKFRESKIDEIYDVCIIDTPPTTDILILNALKIGNYALVPMQTEYLGLVGVIQFLRMFYKMAPKINSSFKLLGVVPTMFNKSMKEHKNIIEKLEKYINKSRVFSPIRKDSKLSKSFAEGKPIMYLDSRCRGSKDYKRLSEEVIDRLKLHCQGRTQYIT